MTVRQHANVPHHVNLNIETIAELRELGIGRHQRAIETVTRKVGRPSSLYGLLALVCVWTGYNLLAPLAGLHEFDPPPFFWLQGTISLYAALVATMVLTTQNRQHREAEQHAHLDLQVNLLVEQKTTKIIALLEELRRDLPSVRDRQDSVAVAMQQQVDPRAVLSALENSTERGGIQSEPDVAVGEPAKPRPGSR